MKSRIFPILVFTVLLNAKIFSEEPYKSQMGQDKYINTNFFKNRRNGIFIDIGANECVRFSNTYFFEKHLDWNGICIEPLPKIFEKLKNNRSCICINGCIADKEGDAQFLCIEGYSEMLSGLLDKYHPIHLNRIKAEVAEYGGRSNIITVPCYRLNDILLEYNLSYIDYLSIDTEGGEYSILASIDFTQFDIDIIDVENNYKDHRIRNLLEKNGYQFITKIMCDEIYKRCLM